MLMPRQILFPAEERTNKLFGPCGMVERLARNLYVKTSATPARMTDGIGYRGRDNTCHESHRLKMKKIVPIKA